MSAPPAIPRPSLAHYGLSTLIIVACLIAAGTSATWLFHRDWQEKTMAISMLSAAIAFAWLQYGSTFRGDPGGTLLVCELSGLLAVMLSFIIGLAILYSWQFLVQNPLSIFSRNLAITGVAFATSATNARLHWKWHAQLEQPGAASRRPDSARSVSLKEVFLLLLAIALVLGVASSGIRLGWHYSNLF